MLHKLNNHFSDLFIRLVKKTIILYIIIAAIYIKTTVLWIEKDFKSKVFQYFWGGFFNIV